MFKRLWHQGFKGRFCSFRWDPLVAKEAQLYAGEYNRSEHRAQLYGEALRQFVQTVKNDVLDVSLVGHSMGNVVCGSALRQGLIVKNYLLMEAAFPAGCYDESGGDGAVGVNGYDRFWNAELNRPTPDYHDSDMGYRGFLKAMHSNTGRLVNFHNRLDYALATGIKFFWFEANWEKNQVDYKPDGSGTAIHASVGNIFTIRLRRTLSRRDFLRTYILSTQILSGRSRDMCMIPMRSRRLSHDLVPKLLAPWILCWQIALRLWST
jgi:pimeloyl-ACP methyl ester carboxylesterase